MRRFVKYYRDNTKTVKPRCMRGYIERVCLEIYINDNHHKHMATTSHYTFYYNTTDFRKTNACVLIGIVILIVVVLLI